ncbi:MAG TPA: RdgB/HAM1 family non-canonical purine NTP pyrophosphatase [Hellea balneolensis]|uniref:dITP/XTP pyrophosphatase n=1 Tax=Hellea balneolensis TaxID=287478 RepID=A0A7V5U190_9PROT|nr:RdgB/HAM1 family non-canonical purine NTP pyrophosphatase [Hellea balneolensis]
MSGKLKTIVVASHNAGKVREIRALLDPFGVETTSARDLGLADIEETGETFAENAAQKALAAARASGLPALADDSGLAVDALNGAPGIYSARYAEDENGKRDFGRAMEKLHTQMQAAGGPDTARFVCVLALAFPDGDVHVYEGKVEGRIVWPPRGDRGFGYDPVFVAQGDVLSFGELDPSEKHAKSHRAHAFAKFIKDWFGDAGSG